MFVLKRAGISKQPMLQALVTLDLTTKLPYSLHLATISARGVKNLVEFLIQFALLLGTVGFAKQVMHALGPSNDVIVQMPDALVYRVTFEQHPKLIDFVDIFLGQRFDASTTVAVNLDKPLLFQALDSFSHGHAG